MAVDPAGNIWLTGHTTVPGSVPVTPDAMQPALIASTCGSFKVPPGIFIPVTCGDAFVIKLDPSGTRVLYATYLGGHGDDGGLAITVDRAGSVYVTGYTGSADFPISSGVLQSKNAGPPVVAQFTSGSLSPGGDIFVTKLNPEGSLAYSTFLGGSGNDTPAGIRVDEAGFVYVAGLTGSADFPLTPSPLSNVPVGTFGGGFIAKISPDGSALSFSTYFPASINGLAIDSSGSTYVTGSTNGLLAATAGAAQVKIGGGTDGFVSKVDPSGKRLVYSTYLGGSSYDYGVAIAVDSHGAAWVGGASWSDNFPSNGSGGGAFLLKIAPDGGAIETGTSLGQSTLSVTDFVAVDQQDNVYSSGIADPADFHPTPNAALAQPCNPSGGRFLLELSPAGSPLYSSFLRRSGIAAVTAPSRVLMFVGRDAPVAALDLSASPALNFQCPVNGASFSSGQITAGEVLSFFGQGLGPQTGVIAQPDPSGHIPASLAGVEVRFNGIPAPVLYAQAGQVNVVAPLALQGFAAMIELTYNGQSAAPLDVSLPYARPGLFAVLNQDGGLNSPSNPARPDSTLQVFATGLCLDFAARVSDGEIAPIPPPLISLKRAPEVLFAGTPGTVVWAGAAPGLIIGVIQVNVQVPESILSGSALAAVPMTMGCSLYASPPMLVSVAK
jgi:uncharacterized protein (TIGR03437 family)